MLNLTSVWRAREGVMTQFGSSQRIDVLGYKLKLTRITRYNASSSLRDYSSPLLTNS